MIGADLIGLSLVSKVKNIYVFLICLSCVLQPCGLSTALLMLKYMFAGNVENIHAIWEGGY